MKMHTLGGRMAAVFFMAAIMVMPAVGADKVVDISGSDVSL